MMTKKEFHRLQDRRINKAEGVPVVVQLDSVSTSENPWWEAVDERGIVVITYPMPKSIDAMLEQVNGLIRFVAKSVEVKL